MRVLGFLGAVIVGLVLWGVALVLSGGVAPLGRTGGNEVMVFFIPIVLFAFPLAVMAFVRDAGLAGTWLLAGAPFFGFLNFAIAATVMGAEPGAWDKGLGASTLSILVAVWLVLLGTIVAAMRR